jgi:diguanylate cyclase (GGDEF)-like protein
VIIFAGHNRLTWRLRSVVDGLISGTALLSLSWVTSLGAVYHATGRSTVAIAVGLAYPVSGVVIMTMLVVVVIRAPRRGRVPLLLLTSGLAAAAVADTAFAYQAATGGSSFGSIVDTGWVAGYLLIGLAALWAWERPVAPAAESPPPSFNRRLLPYLPVAVAMLIAVDEEIRGQQPHGFLFLILLTLVVLVLLRQVLTLRDNADLVRRIGVRERELEYRATHDALTDLINRGRFHARMTETLAQRMAGGGPPAAVLLLDIDGLTRVNTAHGTGTGDRLLVTVARRLTACVRPTDAVARVGSDEFAVLLPQVRGSEQLTEVAERILEAIAVPMDVHDGTSLHSTVSLGVAIAERLDLTADELLRRADVAVHAAMAAGEGLVGVFEPSLEVVLGRPHPRRSRAHRADDEDAVRLWLARELHDDALQKLTTMLIDMEEARREVPETLIGHRVLDFQTSVRSVIGGLRRLLGDLREQPGEDDRLVADLGTLLGQLEVRAGIKGQLSVSSTWPESLSAHIASQLRRIAEEALRNVALHSGAGRVTVSLDTEEERLTLTVSDNGHGCYWPDRRSTGSGMLGMEERALLLGGRLEVSSSPGAGTTVRGTFSAKSA